jgi:hypothetical protein
MDVWLILGSCTPCLGFDPPVCRTGSGYDLARSRLEDIIGYQSILSHVNLQLAPQYTLRVSEKYDFCAGSRVPLYAGMILGGGGSPSKPRA